MCNENANKPDENTSIRDIVCPACGGMVTNTPKDTDRWLYSPINLYCGDCDIEWVI